MDHSVHIVQRGTMFIDCTVLYTAAYIISIPKAVQVSLSNNDNYRGISLFNCICKLYDNVTLLL